MYSKKNQISIRQLFLIFITIIGSPTLRLLPAHTAKYAKQVSWLSAFVGIGVLILLVFVFSYMFDKLKSGSLLDAAEIILGKVLGRVIWVIYLIWSTVLAALYSRYYGDRLVNSIFPNSYYFVFVLIMLVLVTFVLRSGIDVFARMIEIILPLAIFVYALTCVILLPIVDINNLTPVTHKDILPVLTGSISPIGILCYISFVFLMADKVKNKNKGSIKRMGFISSGVLLPLVTAGIIMPVGILGYNAVTKLNLPFFSASKATSFLGIIDRLESGIVATWVLTDFAIISVFLFVGLNINKKLFNLSDEKPLISIYVVLVYILTLYISDSNYEIIAFSEYIALPVNIALGVVIPIIIFALGKLRKKI